MILNQHSQILILIIFEYIDHLGQNALRVWDNNNNIIIFIIIIIISSVAFLTYCKCPHVTIYFSIISKETFIMVSVPIYNSLILICFLRCRTPTGGRLEFINNNNNNNNNNTNNKTHQESHQLCYLAYLSFSEQYCHTQTRYRTPTDSGIAKCLQSSALINLCLIGCYKQGTLSMG